MNRENQLETQRLRRRWRLRKSSSHQGKEWTGQRHLLNDLNLSSVTMIGMTSVESFFQFQIPYMWTSDLKYGTWKTQVNSMFWTVSVCKVLTSPHVSKLTDYCCSSSQLLDTNHFHALHVCSSQTTEIINNFSSIAWTEFLETQFVTEDKQRSKLICKFQNLFPIYTDHHNFRLQRGKKDTTDSRIAIFK